METGIEVLYKGVVETSLEEARVKKERKERGEAQAGCARSRLRKKPALIDLTGSPSPGRADGQ